MKRVMTVACVLSLALATSLVVQAAQAPMAKPAITSEADYSVAMKEVGSTAPVLMKAIASGNEADATKAAERLGAIFKDVQAYWEGKKVQDATTAATDAVAAAQAVSKALAAHDMTAAGEARVKLAATCMACHMAHRERLPDGSFRMK